MMGWRKIRRDDDDDDNLSLYLPVTFSKEVSMAGRLVVRPYAGVALFD
jgi:hypothetical protein